MAWLISKALDHRWLVLGLSLLIAGFGVWSFNRLPVDAYPDISPQKVSIVTAFPGRAPEEVEQQVTIPIEVAMRSVPKVESVRSQTIFGLSVIDLVFEEGTETYWARQQVLEKLRSVGLPEGAESPELGPVASACGEIYRYELVSDGSYDLMELQSINEWNVIPRLMRVPGVAEVSNFGGLKKQFAVIFSPANLARYALSLSDVVSALENNNAAAGGSMMPRGSMALVIRSTGLLENIEQINNIFVKSIDGMPVYMKDVATIELDAETPWSIYSKDDTDESVEGIVLLRRGENPSFVLTNISKAVEQLNREGLPDAVKIVPFYNRQFLVDSTLHTVTHSVSLGITLVVLILLLFLGRTMMAFLVALTIPFSFLVALGLMDLTHIPIGLLSIGAIDFGILVDGSVIMADNIARRLGESKVNTSKEVIEVVRVAALDMCKPIFISITLIMVAFVPLFSLTGIEGLLFRPMAMTILYALIGSLFFALFLVPVLATIFFRRGYREWENPVLKLLIPFYTEVVEWLLKARYLVATAAIGALVIVLFELVPRLGVEFLPYMDEGTIWVKANFPAGTSLKQTANFGKRLREIAATFPDVQFSSAQVGRADAFSEPFPASRIEMMIAPKNQSQWQEVKTKHELIAGISEKFRNEFPTTRFNFTQPIIDMVTQDTNGSSAQLAVEITGEDHEILLSLALQTEALLRKVPGSLDVNIEQEEPQAQLRIVPDRKLCARYNVKIEDVTRVINIAMGGDPIGILYEGQRRYNIVAKFDRKMIHSPQAVGQLPVYTEDGTAIPLSQVTSIEVVDGQTVIARSEGSRRLTVRANVVGRDEGGFVLEAQKLFSQEIKLPTGYHVEWLGMFENLDRAFRHFLFIIPITIAIIFMILVVTFGSLRAGFILLLPIPFAFAGGAIALYLRDMHLNVSTGVGFATLFGIAIMDGVLMFKGITRYRLMGYNIDEAIIKGRISLLRPILIVSLVAILGLLPASLATSLGSDVQRPLATVIIWGLTGSTLFTLFITPVFYRIFAPPLKEKIPDRLSNRF